MWPDRVWNPGPLTYESGAPSIALCSPATGYAESDRSIGVGRGKVGRQIPPPVFTSGIYRYLPVWKILLKWQILAN